MASTATQRFLAVGRRKTSVARVTLSTGTGSITVNGMDADKYFHRETSSIYFRMPLVIVDAKNSTRPRVFRAGTRGRYRVQTEPE